MARNEMSMIRSVSPLHQFLVRPTRKVSMAAILPGPVSTQRNLHVLSRAFECLNGCFHVQRQMWASVVVEADPVTDGAYRMLDAVEEPARDALSFQLLD